MNQPAGTKVVMSSNPCVVGEQDGPGVGVPGGVGVGGGGVGVQSGHGVGVTQDPPVTTTLSTLQPVPVTLSSEHIRKRSLIVCPTTFGPRLAVVVIYPLELWLQA